MEQAYSRMNAYHTQAEADAQWYRETATRYGMNPDNIVKPFKRPRKWGEEEEVVGSGGAAQPEFNQPPTPEQSPAGNYNVGEIYEFDDGQGGKIRRRYKGGDVSDASSWGE